MGKLILASIPAIFTLLALAVLAVSVYFLDVTWAVKGAILAAVWLLMPYSK